MRNSDLRGSISLRSRPAVPKPALLRPPQWMRRRSERQPVAWSQETQDDVSLRSFANAPPSQTQSECLFFRMPAEINYEIISHLPYPDARALKNSSRFFRVYITPDFLTGCKEQWKSSLLDQDIAGQFVATERLPCYTCVRLRPAKTFPRPNQHTSATPRCSERVCIECSWKVYKKGEAIWIEHHAYTRCKWCGRAGRAYRFEQDGSRPGLCGFCGRIHRLSRVWPAVLVQIAEILLSFCCIVWTSWGSADGWLIGYPDDKDWDKGEFVRALIIIPLIQMFLSSVYFMNWNHSSNGKGPLLNIMVNFWLAMMAWVWALCESSHINKDIVQGFQLSCFVIAAGISAILLNFLRWMAFICAKGKVPF